MYKTRNRRCQVSRFTRFHLKEAQSHDWGDRPDHVTTRDSLLFLHWQTFLLCQKPVKSKKHIPPIIPYTIVYADLAIPYFHPHILLSLPTLLHAPVSGP
jgi:hypothetical protein